MFAKLILDCVLLSQLRKLENRMVFRHNNAGQTKQCNNLHESNVTTRIPSWLSMAQTKHVRAQLRLSKVDNNGNQKKVMLSSEAAALRFVKSGSVETATSQLVPRVRIHFVPNCGADFD